MIDYFFFFVGNACVMALLLGVFRGYFNRVWACIFWVGLAASVAGIVSSAAKMAWVFS